jgi:hypothetical protein
VLGQYTWVWGLEFFQSNPEAADGIALDAFGVGTRLINNIVHDAGQSGIGFWWNTQGGEAYGNIVYNNGTHDNLDHGIYFNNRTGTKKLTDNIVFNNWAYGFHGYSTVPGELTGLELDGNVSFGGHGIGLSISADLMVGGTSIPSLTVTNQRSFRADGYTSVDLGYFNGEQNRTLVVRDGYFVGSPGLQLNRWSSITSEGNTVVEYFDRPASGIHVTVRPNAYEPGRGHVIIYNWGRAASVPVDLSTVLSVGQSYEVKSVCDLWGGPKASGTYQGGLIDVSMAAHSPPVPVGRRAKRPPAMCGGEFGVFLVTTK